jgi:hypothetical protein
MRKAAAAAAALGYVAAGRSACRRARASISSFHPVSMSAITTAPTFMG